MKESILYMSKLQQLFHWNEEPSGRFFIEYEICMIQILNQQLEKCPSHSKYLRKIQINHLKNCEELEGFFHKKTKDLTNDKGIIDDLVSYYVDGISKKDTDSIILSLNRCEQILSLEYEKFLDHSGISDKTYLFLKYRILERLRENQSIVRSLGRNNLH